MSSYQNSPIDIPDDQGVHTKSAGAKGEKYVYKYVKYYRNADGNPRNIAKSIGKYDPITGKMFPNSNYYEMYHVDPILHDVSVWDYGYSYLALKVCHDTGLLHCLEQAFPERAMDIVVIAAYIIREGSAMDGIDDWLQRNYFPGFSRLLTSQSTSRIFTSLTSEQMSSFFEGWVKASLGAGSVCYDVTSISSYAQEMPTVERGYNRDGDDLAQYNLGIFSDEASKTPIYYNRYNGSLTDRTNLSHVLANAKAVGITCVKMVLDGGFWSEECLSSLRSLCAAFMVGMPSHLKDAEEIIATHGDGIEKYANELTGRQIYCIPVNTELCGISGRVMLYYDPWNHLSLCNDLSERINRLSAELAALKRYPKSKLSRYAPYFTLMKHKDGNGFDYKVDEDKVEALRKNKGFFLIFSSDAEATPGDVLDHYRAKDTAEKLFSQIKVEMDGNRIRTHNERTTEGKTFVTFIACVIRSNLLTRLRRYLTDNSTSLKKAFNQLSNITILSGQEGYRFTKALSKKQKQILTAFDAVDDIVHSLK